MKYILEGNPKEVAKVIEESRRNPDGYTKKKFDPNSDYVKRYGTHYCMAKWQFLRDSDIPISAKCCQVMKKTQGKANPKVCKGLIDEKLSSL